MVVETDYISLVLGPVLAAIVSFLIIGVTKLGKTSDVSLLGTAEIRHLHENLTEVKERVDRICDRLDKIEATGILYGYRLDVLDKDKKYRDDDSNK